MSIVLPTFNRADFLNGAVESCLTQTHADLEVIVVDDGSADATADVVRRWDDARLVYLRHDRNLGLPEALNTGFRRATGAYLSWLADDDRYAPTAIAEMLQFLEHSPEVDFTYAAFSIVDENDNVIGEVEARPLSRLESGNCVGPCRLYRRAVYEVLGDHDPSAFLAEDYEYWLRVAGSFRMAPLQRRLYYFRVHPGSLSERFRFEARRAAADVRLKHGRLTVPAHRRALELVEMEQAFANARRGEFWRMTLAAIARDPRHLLDRAVYSLLLDALIGTHTHERLRVLRRRVAAGANSDRIDRPD